MPRGRVVAKKGKYLDKYVKPKETVKIVVEKAKKKKDYQPSMGRQLLRGGGSLLGGLFGPSGAAFGGNAGDMAATLLGMGSYKVKGNSLLQPDGVPYMHSTNASIRVKHKEFISDLSSSVAFTNQMQLHINPGLSNVFPWLSGLAQNFERYQLHGCVVYFRSTSADALNSTNTALGTVIIASDMDSSDTNYSDKQSMEASSFSCSGRPSRDLMSPIECAPSDRFNNQLFIRSDFNTQLSTISDIKTFDWCKTQVATTGSQAAAVIGEIWISYDITLYQPQLSVPRGLDIKYHHAFQGAYSNAAPLGTAAWVAGTNYVDYQMFLSLNTTTITFPKNSYGQYLITMIWEGDATACTSPTLAFTNATSPAYLLDHSSGNATNGSTTTTVLIQIVPFVITDPTVASSLALSAATLPANGDNFDLVIQQINGRAALTSQ